MVTPLATRTPIAATLRSGPRSSAFTHAPLRPSTLSVGTPSAAQTAIMRVLEPADVTDDVDRLRQHDDRIAGELARAVPGDLAAAVDVDDRRAVGRALPDLGTPTRGVDGVVLEQQHGVGDLAGHPLRVQVALLGPGVVIADSAEANELQRAHPFTVRRSACG